VTAVATVYLNELDLRASVRASRPIEAGEPVTRDDFVDVERLEIGVQVPKDVGALFIFSVGWRKGLFYDFGPVAGPFPRPRDDVYLPIFSPNPQHDAEVPRDSEVQGTTSTSRFGRKAAVIGILIIHQLFYILENRTNGSKTNESS